MSEVVMYPYREAVAEAKRELAIARTPEAEAMLEAILTAVQRYADYLEQSGLFYTDTEDPDDCRSWYQRRLSSHRTHVSASTSS
jgi:hypothetical protein